MRQQVIYSALIMAVAPVAAMASAVYQQTTPVVVPAGSTVEVLSVPDMRGEWTTNYRVYYTLADKSSYKFYYSVGNNTKKYEVYDGNAHPRVNGDVGGPNVAKGTDRAAGEYSWRICYETTETWGQTDTNNGRTLHVYVENTGSAPMTLNNVKLRADDDYVLGKINSLKDQILTYQTTTIKDYTTVSAENNARLQLLLDMCNKKTEEWTIENFERFSLYKDNTQFLAEFNSVKAEIEAAEAAKYLEASGYNDMTDEQKAALSDDTKAALTAADNADADHKVAATQYAAFLVKCDKVQAQIDRYTKLLDDYDASVGTEVKEDGTGGALLGTAEAEVFRTHEKRLAGFVATLAKFRELGTYDIDNETTFTEPTDVNVSSSHNSYKNIDELLGSSDDAVPEARTKTGILESIGFAEYCSDLYQEKFLLVFNKITELLNIAVDGKDAIDAKIAKLNAIDPEFQVKYAQVIEEYKQKLTEDNNNVLNDILTDWVAVKKAGAPISYQSKHGPSTGLRKGFGIQDLDEPDAAAWETATADQYVPWQNKLHEVYVNNKDGYKQVDLMVFALQSAYDEWILERTKIKDMENTLDDIKDGIEQLPDDAKAKTIFNDRIDQLALTLDDMKTSADATNEASAAEAYFDQVSLTWKKIKDNLFDKLADGDILRVVNSTTGDIVKEIVCNNPDSEEEFSFYLLKGDYDFFIIDASETTDGDEKEDITLGIKGSYYKAEEGHVAPVPQNISNANQFLGNYNNALDNLQQLAADILESVAEYNAYKDVQAQVYKMDGEGDAAVPADGTLLKRYEAAKAALDELTKDLKTVRDDDAADKVYQDSEFLHDIANKIEGYIRAVKKEIETAYGLGTQKEGERKWNDGTDPNGDGKGNATQWSLNDDGKVKKVWQADNMKARVEISAPSVKTPNSVTSKWGIAVRFGEQEQGNQIFMPKGTYTFTFGLKQEIADRPMSLQIHNDMTIGSSDDPQPTGTQITAVSSTDAANWKVVDGEDGMKLVTATITLADALDKGGILIAEATPHGNGAGFTISNLTYTVDAHDLWQAKALTPIDKQGNAITGLTAEKWTDVTTLLEQLESTTGEAQEAIKHYKDARTAYQSDADAIQAVLDAVKNHGVYTDLTSSRANRGIYAGPDGYIAKLNKLLKEQRTDAFTDIETPGANIDYSPSEQGENYDEKHWQGIQYNLKTVRMYVNEALTDVADAADADHKLIEEWFTADKIAQDKALYDFAVEEEGVYALAKQIYGDTGNDNNLHTDGLAYEVLTKWTADKALTYDALTAGVDPAKVFGKKAADVLKAWTDAKTTIVNTATTKGKTTGVRKVWLADYKDNIPYASLTDQKAALSTARDALLGLKDQLDAFNYATYKEDGQDYTNGELLDTKVNDITFSKDTNLELLKKYTVDIANAFSDNQALYDSLTVDVPSGQRGAFLVVIDEAKAAKDNVTAEIFPGLDDTEISIIKDYYQDVIDELSLGGGLRDDVENGYTNETLRDDFHADQGIQQEFAFLKERLYLIGKYCQLRSDANLASDAISQVAIPTIETNTEKYGEWEDNGKGPDVFVRNLFKMGGDTWKDESTDHNTKLTQRFVGWEIIDGEGYLDTDGTNAINFHDIVDGSTNFGNYCSEDAKYAEHLNEYDAEGNVKETAFRTDADQYLERFAELISVLGTSATTINDPNKIGTVNVSDIEGYLADGQTRKFFVTIPATDTEPAKTVVPHDLIARQMQAAELNKSAYDELNDINERLKTRVNTILGYLDNPSMHQATDEGTALKDIIYTYYKPVYATMQTRIQDLYDAGNAYWESSAQTRKPKLETKVDKTATGDWYFTEAEDGTKSLKLDKNAQGQTFSPDDQLAYYVIKDSLDNLNTLYNTFSENYDQYLVQKNNDIFSNEVQSAYEKAFATQKQAVLDLEEFKAPKDPDLLKAFNDAFKRATETIYAAPDALRKALALAKQSKLNADENNATYDPLNAWIKLDGEGKNTTYTDKGTTANIDPFEGNEYIDGVYDGTKTDATYIEAIEKMITDEFNEFVGAMKGALADRTNKVLTTETNINGRVATAWDEIKGYFAKDVFPTYEKFSDVYPTDGSEDDWFYDAKKAATDLNALNTTIQDPAWNTYTQFKEADAIIISDVVANFDDYMTGRLNDAAELDLTNRVEIAFKQYVMPNAQKIEGAVITRTVTIDEQTKTYTYGEPQKDGEGNEVDFSKPYDTQYLGFGEPVDNRNNYWSFKHALQVVNKDKEGDAYAILVKEHDDLVAATVGAAALKLRELINAGTVYTNRTEVMNLYKQYKDYPAKFNDIYNKFINGFTDAATSIEYYGYSKFLENTDYAYAIEDLDERIDKEIAGISSLYVGTEPARQADLADIKKEFEEEKAAPGTHNIYDLTKQLDDQIVDAKADDYTAMLEELTKLKNEYNLLIANAATQEEKDALTDKFANPADETLNIEKNIERIKELQQKLDADMNGVLDNPRDLSDDFDYEEYVKVESNVSKIKAEIAGKTADDLAAICTDLLGKVQALLDTESQYLTGAKVLYPENPAFDDFKYTDFGLHKNYLDVQYQDALKEIEPVIAAIGTIQATIQSHKDKGDILLFQENIEKQIAEYEYGKKGNADLANIDKELNSNVDGDNSLWQLNQYVIEVAENQKTQYERLQKEIDDVKELIDPAVATINAQQAKYIDGDGNEQTLVADMTEVNEKIAKMQQRLNALYLQRDNALTDKVTLATDKGKKSYNIGMFSTHPELVTDEWLEKWGIADKYNKDLGVAQWTEKVDGLAKVQKQIEDMVEYAIDLRAQNKYDEACAAYTEAGTKLNSTTMRADQKDALLVKFRGADVSVANEGDADDSFQKRLWVFYQNKNDRTKETIDQYAADIDKFIKDLLGVENDEGQLEGGLVQEIDDTKAGDSNGDGNINALDLAYLLLRVNNPNYIVDTDFARCDLNNDGYIDVVDLGIMMDILAGGTADDYLYTEGVLSARAAKAAGEHLVATVAAQQGNSHRIAISLQNVREYTAFQMDLVLPEGMRLAGQSLTDRANGQELYANEWNGKVRIVAFTAAKSAFTANDGDLLYLDVETTDDYKGENVRFDNVLFLTTNSKGQRFQMEGAVATGIMDRMVNAADAAKQTIYNMGGRVMETLKKGVNILRGENGDSQKVIKK